MVGGGPGSVPVSINASHNQLKILYSGLKILEIFRKDIKNIMNILAKLSMELHVSGI